MKKAGLLAGFCGLRKRQKYDRSNECSGEHADPSFEPDPGWTGVSRWGLAQEPL
jgi:hypothetical protein